MLKLILPVIFPSWRFFSSIDASPRIEYAFFQSKESETAVWQAFLPRPARLSFMKGLHCLLWNPHWNETLYLNTCAEHLCDEYSIFREQEIMSRLLAAVNLGKIMPVPNAQFIQFRISTVARENNRVVQPMVFISQPVALSSNAP